MNIFKKKFSSVIACTLSVLIMAASPMLLIDAGAVSQAEIDALQEKRDALTKQLDEQQTVIDKLTNAKALVVQRKQALDDKIELNQQEIELITSQVKLYDEMIAEKEAELAKAREKETQQTALLRERMRYMEENGHLNYIAFVFDATSLTDLLSRIADVNNIMQYDKVLEKQYKEAKEDVEAIKNSFEATQLQQQNLIKELDTRQQQLKSQVEAASQLIADIMDAADIESEEYDALMASKTAAEEEMNALIAKRAAEQAAAAAAQGGGTGGTGGGSATSIDTVEALSNFGWPVPSCTLITSRFGNRVSPTAGASSYHGGLDIGAQMGAAIVAAESGEVILAGENGGYGNCVMIDHGNGLVTVYGHMSSIAVSYGSFVSKGQMIGSVGSTGVSTGPHCHYEIRINGAQTDPAVYYSGLSYYNC